MTRDQFVHAVLAVLLFIAAYIIIVADSNIKVYRYEHKIHLATIDSLTNELSKHKECILLIRVTDTTKKITKNHRIVK